MMRLALPRTASVLLALVPPLAWCQWCAAAIETGGLRDDEQTSIVYDASTGELSVNAPASTELTSINIDSASGIFAGEPQNLGGSFDNFGAHNIFKATFGSSFGSLGFGFVAPARLNEAFVANDLTVVGSLADGGDLGDVDLIYIGLPWLPRCGAGVTTSLFAMMLMRLARVRSR